MPQADLDWTFDDIPGDEHGETGRQGAGKGSPGGGRRPPRRLPGWLSWRNRRLLAILGGLLLVASVAGLAVYRVGWERLRAQIAQEVAYEEEQSLATNPETVRAAQAAGYPAWAGHRAEEAALGWPATPPTDHLLPTADPPRVTGVRALEPGLVEATVLRTFADSAGGTYAFAFTQRYTSPQPGIWERLPPMASDALVIWTGQRLSVTLPAGDSSWLLPLLTQVDNTLGRACADWACPAETVVSLVLVEDVALLPAPAGGQHARPPGAAPQPEAASQGYPVVLSLPYPGVRNWRQPLRLPGPALAGRPHDEAAAAALLRGYTGQALADLAGRLARTARRAGNLYLDALIARAEIRLNVSPAPGWRPAPQAYIAPELLMTGTRPGVPAFGARPDPATSLQALGFLDFALAGQPASVDAELLAAFSQAQDLKQWLARSLPAGQDAASLITAWKDQVAQQLGALAPPDWASLAGLAYACGDQLYFVRDEGPVPVDTRGQVVWLMNNARSPDGRYLAALVMAETGHQAELHLVDLTGGPSLFVADQAWPAGWASTGDLVYLVPADTPAPADFGYNLFQFSPATMQRWPITPEPVVPEWRPDLAWSADHRQLAVTLLQASGSNVPSTSPALVVFEPVPQVIKFATRGHSASLSPDGGRLAYVEGDLPWLDGASASGAASNVSLLDLGSRTVRTLVASPASPDTDFHTLTGLTWSPDGRRLGLIDYTPAGTSRLILVRFAEPPSEQIELAAHPLADSLSFYYYGFSANSRYLAAWGEANGQAQVVVLDVDTGATLPGLTTTNLGSWSLSGQLLAVPGHAGLYVFDAATGTTQWVAAGECAAGW